MASVLPSPVPPIRADASTFPLRDAARAFRAAFGRLRRPALSPTLLAKSIADHAACVFRRACTRSLSDEQWTRIIGEVEAATDFLGAAGWLKRPDLYHLQPLDPPRERIRSARSLGRDFEHLSFDSGYEPRLGEPGGTRWMGYAPCRTAHAWLLRRDGAERPWLVCIPGYSMGMPYLDLSAFSVGWLLETLGVNVAIPVLPLHGPRRIRRMSGDGYFAGDCLDTLHAQAQAVWDVRRLLSWIRAAGATSIGLYGISLGGYTAALIAALEYDLACVVAGVPPSDFVRLAQHHTPRAILRRGEELGFDWRRASSLFRVVSPLALEPRVAWERRYLFGGTVDRIVPQAQVRDLWEHWQRPSTIWYPGSHMSLTWEPTVRAWLRERLLAALSPAGAAQRA